MARDNPFEIFEKYPLDEIRKICLKQVWELGFQNTRGIDRSEELDWSEKCAKDLLQQGDPLWKDVLALYVQNTKPYGGTHPEVNKENWENVIRSIEFAISLVDFNEVALKDRLSTVAKTVTGKIKDCPPEIYGLVPSLPKFINKLLTNCIIRDPDGTIRYACHYQNTDWYNIIRALTMLVRCPDASFIPVIEELILLIKQKKLKPFEYDFAPNIATTMSHLVVLNGTRNILKKRQREILKETRPGHRLSI